MDDKNLVASEETEIVSIPYVVHESEMARERKHTKHVWIALFLVFATLVASNAYWIYKDHQYVDEEVTVTQTGDSAFNNYVGNDGDIVNGADKANG